jgi:mono/diheme cytochrome c family protein
MSRVRWFGLIGVTVALGVLVRLAVAGPPAPAAPPEQAARLFASEVLPLLKAKCFACHGDDTKDLRGGLDLRSREKMLAGGESGDPALVPSDTAKSPIIRAVTWDGLKMPPKANDRLTPAQVETLRQWVAAGAPWPDEREQARLRELAWSGPAGGGVRVRTSGGLTDEWTNRPYDPADLWAYRPVRRPAVPEIPNPKSQIPNPVDAFLSAKLQAAGLAPAGEADKRTLIRRVTFDLTGLPPAPEKVDAFLADGRPDAYERLVERLLASPHYGEQQARLWLDVARYADSAGFSNDFERPHAWRYRDYVVRSFNADKPYDRFVLEQLAGDELAPADPEMLIAVSFLRMGPWEHTGMSVAVITRQQYLDDVTNAVGETFLAAPMSCCRCHDHKFDPLPTRDYYRLQAVFAPVQFADRDVPFLPTENLTGLEAARDRVERLMKTVPKDVVSALGPGASPKEREEAELAVVKVRAKRNDALQRDRQMFKPLAMSVYDGPPFERRSNQPYHPLPSNRHGSVPAVHILTGGSLEAAAATVKPGVLSVVYAPSATVPETTEGRRLALARWIASPENPLTTRVIVNRLWQQHFGQGLAANPNNFGKMGRKPTHPELLDWLAGYFVDHGWSVKELHRLIVTSAAYRRAGEPADPAAAERLDPLNQLLGHYPPRRLTAEELRDATLAVTGELNPALGGLPARPEIHWDVAVKPRHVMGSVAPAYQPSRTPAERHRRTLYALRIRTLRDPLLEVFDRPTPDLSCERRTESTVTPQVFSLFNGQSSHDRALALARRLEREADTPAGRVERAFRLAFGRPPTGAETRRALDHVARQTEHHRRHTPVPSRPPTAIVRALVEEQTGTEVPWRERLDVYEDFVPDVKPWDVGPETRALADLCLVLFNTNEFAYVY